MWVIQRLYENAGAELGGMGLRRRLELDVGSMIIYATIHQ
jgi:hypothetical protein